MATPASDLPIGALRPVHDESEFGRLGFLIGQRLAQMQTAALVRVVAVHAEKQTVDVQPMVHQMDSTGLSMPHGTIYGLPYTRIQGGGNALIIDPSPGDIGFCVFCSRDTSKAREAKAPSPPGSHRRNDWADGIYTGGVAGLCGPATQTIKIDGGGITLTAPTITLAGDVTVTGALTAATAATATGIDLGTHTHSAGGSGPPNP